MWFIHFAARVCSRYKLLYANYELTVACSQVGHLPHWNMTTTSASGKLYRSLRILGLLRHGDTAVASDVVADTSRVASPSHPRPLMYFILGATCDFNSVIDGGALLKSRATYLQEFTSLRSAVRTRAPEKSLSALIYRNLLV